MAEGMQRNGEIYSIGPNILLNKSFSYQIKPIVVTFLVMNTHSPYLYLSHSSAQLEQARPAEGWGWGRGKSKIFHKLDNSFVVNQELAVQ